MESTKDNWKMTWSMAMAFKNGQMEQGMKADGYKVRQKDMESFTIRMAIYTKVSSPMTSSMAKEFTFMLMGQSTQAIGQMACNSELAFISGPTETHTKESSETVKSMAKEHSSGTTRVITLVLGLMIWCKAKGILCGQMEEVTKANGRRIWSMAMVSINGRMEGSTRESIISIISMAGEFINGLMDRGIKDLGWMEKGTEKEDIIWKITVIVKEFGTLTRESIGKQAPSHHKMIFNKKPNEQSFDAFQIGIFNSSLSNSFHEIILFPAQIKARISNSHLISKPNPPIPCSSFITFYNITVEN